MYDAIVVFHSPGGNLVAGIEIAKPSLEGFSNICPCMLLCASACSLAGGSLSSHERYSQSCSCRLTDQAGQNSVSAPAIV